MKDKKILIIDNELKNTNDRTWCFWEREAGPFDAIVHHKWDKVWFYGLRFSKLLNLEPYAYKMIKGDRFYEYSREILNGNTNIKFVNAEIKSVNENSEKAIVETTLGDFEGGFAFNSIVKKKPRKQQHHYLLQHFKGLIIRTKDPVFNPSEPVLMDFRIVQENECRFMYVLPTSPFEALVEFTIFSGSHLESLEYDAQINSYISEFLKITHFEVLHSEFGSIPMFSEPFETGKGTRILNIGTAGGQTKASSGYTFTRIQKHSAYIAQNLAKTGFPLSKSFNPKPRFRYYDNVLLHVIANNIVGGARVFENLFKYNTPKTIFRFLDEDTHFLEEYRLNTLPIFKFIGPGWKELLKISRGW